MSLKKIHPEKYDQLVRVLGHHVNQASLHIVLVALAQATEHRSIKAALAVARAAGSKAVRAISEEVSS